MSVMAANSMSSAMETSTSAVTSQETAEWIILFPLQITQSYTSSVAFMKQLTVIAVSTITYLKEIFPQECYQPETLGGVELTILKAKCEDKAAQFISTALIQSFEALEKKYLAKLVLCLYEGSCHADNLVEAHSFEFSYSPGGVSMDVRSSGRGACTTLPGRDRRRHAARYDFESIRERTLDLLNACVIASQTYRRENQGPYDISLRLYYNGEAPAGYQAPGFSPVSAAEAAEACDPVAPALADSTELGSVETPFHQLVARSYVREPASSHEAIASSNAPVMTQYDSADFGSEQHVPPLSRGADAPAVRCECGPCYEADDPPFLTCDYCGTMQHAVCYGIRRSAAAAEAPHCCTRCFDLDPARRPTCQVLARTRLVHRQGMCLYRRTLVWAADVRSVSASSLAARLQLSTTTASKLFKSLQKSGVLVGDSDDFDSSLKINGEQLNKWIIKSFHSNENTVVEQLLAESLTQERTPDPVSDMLAPAEQISLQKATTMGKIIQHTPDTVVEDSTLQQYKEAIFSTEKHTDEELPLSGTHNPVKNIVKIGDKAVTKRKIEKDGDKTGTKRKMDTPNDKFWKSRLRNAGKTKKPKV